MISIETHEIKECASCRDETLTLHILCLNEKLAQICMSSKPSVSSRQDCTLGFPSCFLKQALAQFQDMRHAARTRRHPLLTMETSVSFRRNARFQYLHHSFHECFILRNSRAHAEFFTQLKMQKQQYRCRRGGVVFLKVQRSVQ